MLYDLEEGLTLMGSHLKLVSGGEMRVLIPLDDFGRREVARDVKRVVGWWKTG